MDKQAAKKLADEIKMVSSPEGHGLDNIAGKIATGMLREHGWYAATFDGRKVFFEVRATGRG